MKVTVPRGLMLAPTLFLALLLGNGCHGAPVEWDYQAHNASKWPSLFQKWCSFRTQSPIKLTFSDATFDADLPTYALTEQNLAGLNYTAYNDGHKVGVVFASVMPNVSVTGHPGSCFRPQSLHWHWGFDDSQGSEHWIEGRRFPMEGHIVMWNCQFYSSYVEALDGFGGLAVLGFMYESDASVASVSPGLSSLMSLLTTNSIMQQCPGCKNESFTPPSVNTTAFSLNDILPTDRSQYYLYSGSLTSPDCRENVLWTVYRQTIRVPPSVLATFRALKFADGAPMGNNYRPTLLLNPYDPFGARRMVVRSFSSIGTGGGGIAGLSTAGARQAASPAVVAVAAAAFGLLMSAGTISKQ